MNLPSFSSPPSPDSSAVKLVRRQNRRTRLALLIWSLATMILSVAAIQSQVVAAWPLATLVSLGLAVISVAFLFRWFQRFARIQESDTARRLDQQWQLQARLESTLELQADSRPFAISQRHDTAQRLAGRRPPFGLNWKASIAFLGLALLLTLAQWTGLVGRAFHFPSTRVEPKAAATPPAQNKDSSDRLQTPDTFADIHWLAPPKTTRASAIEEVWLKAATTSARGLDHAALVVSVNGGASKSIPVSPEAAGPMGQPGDQAVDFSLYLDELSVNDYDLVSYFLKANPIGNGTETEVTSPMQFIQVRPAREEIGKGGDGKGNEIIARLFALQAAQLDLLQQNFLLVHTHVSHRDPDWIKFDGAVTTGQAELAPTAADLRRDVIAQSGPAKMVDDLGQAAEHMTTASQLIRAEKNSDAVAEQQRALALLADADRLIHKATGGAPPKAADPFPNQQKLDLPDRAKTVAGKLDALSAQQDQLVNNLAGSTGEGDSAGAGTKGKQAALAKDLQALSATKGLSPSVQDAAQRAAKEAASAAQRLAANDPKSALPPATAASTALHEAIEIEQRNARAAALAVLEANRRALNEAARIDDPTTRDRNIEDIAGELRAGGLAQQEIGSETLAADLVHLAQDVHALGSRSPASDQWNEADKSAAKTQIGVDGLSDAVNRAIRQLDRGRRQIAEGKDENGRAELELAAQMGRELLASAADKHEAQKILDALRKRGAGAPTEMLTTPDLLNEVLKLQQALGKIRMDGKRDERVRRFNPDAIDPAYRSSVETYFKSLSRGTSTP